MPQAYPNLSPAFRSVICTEDVTSVMGYPPRTLSQWERELQEQVAGGDVLLGQLPLEEGTTYNDSDMQALGRLLATRFRKAQLQTALDAIERDYPLSYALYLVLQGIFNYRGGDYWSGPSEHLGLQDANQTSKCGLAFRRILRKFNLPTFDYLQGHVNLTPILAHGGIPSYSMGDFFRLLNTSIRDSKFAIDADSLIEGWAVNPDATFFFTDRPVQRFVLNGGDVAEDFINRCIQLFFADSEQELHFLGLPTRVVAAFHAWREENAEQYIHKPRIRLQRPYLYLDPYGDGVCLALPPQQFPADLSFSQLTWSLTENDHYQEIVCDRQRTAIGYEFIVNEVKPVAVAAEYSLALKCDEETIRSWSLPGVSDPPLLLFDPDTGELLQGPISRQPGIKWIVYPNEYSLEISDGHKRAELPQQYGSWGKYTIEEWVVSAGSQLKLKTPEGSEHPFKFHDDIALRRPYLEEGFQPLDQSVRSNLPLYSGRPPLLVIPFAQAPTANELSRWRISIHPEGAAQPAAPVSYLVSELENGVIIGDDNAYIELDSTKLLGPRPFGTFELNILGPFGRGRRMRLRLVPHLDVEGHRRLFLSPEDGPARLRLFCAAETSISCIQNQGVRFSPESNDGATKQYAAEIDTDTHLARFVVADPRSEIRVPFSIRIRRLKWTMWHRDRPEKFEWQTSPFRLFPQAVEGVFNTELFVDLPTRVEDNKLYAGWQLIDSDQNVLIERQPNMAKSRQQFSIPLAELLPACRQAQEDGIVLCLQIDIRQSNTPDKAVLVNTLYLLPTLDLGQTKAEWYHENKYAKVGLTWESHQSSPHLHLLLWPLDQPWRAEPLKLPVPPNNKGHAKWSLSFSDEPLLRDYGGDFLGEMVILDPWTTSMPERPNEQQANTVIFQPQYSAQYYRWLEKRHLAGLVTPEEALAAIAYYHRTGKKQQMQQANILLSQYAKEQHLELNQLILWADLVRDKADTTAYRIVQWSLFSQELFEKIEMDSADSPHIDRYLAHLPDTMPDPRIYTRLLNAGFPQVRQKCLAALCRAGDSLGIDDLMEDVARGEVVVSQAAAMLAPAAEKVRQHLATMKTQDAFDVLSALARMTDNQVDWIQPGFSIDADVGTGLVQKISAQDSGHLRYLNYCRQEDNCHVELIISNGHESLKARLLLPDGIIEFLNIPSMTVYQCTTCSLVFSDYGDLARHHDSQHLNEPTSFKELKPPKVNPRKLLIRLPEKEGGDEYSSN
jgi:hypothetical protein